MIAHFHDHYSSYFSSSHIQVRIANWQAGGGQHAQVPIVSKYHHLCAKNA